MNLLIIVPLLPLAVALWLALPLRMVRLGEGWVVALVAAFPMAVAVLLAPQRLELLELFVQGNSALVLDRTARASLLLFGGLWLTAGLVLTRSKQQGPAAIALLVALSGANTLALAEGGSLVYAGMVAVGYGLYGIMAGEPGREWRRAGCVLVALLVVSDLLVFELILSSIAKPEVAMPEGAGMPPWVMAMGLLALILRGGVPPAHAWLPRALVAVSPATAVLLAAVPAGAGLYGVLKLLPDGAPALAIVCLVIGLAGAAWTMVAGVMQQGPRATLGYAMAGTAALLLLALPAGAGEGAKLAWLGLGLLAAGAAVPLVALQRPGWPRDFCIGAVLLVHGLAGGHAAVHACSMLPPLAVLLPPLAAVAATSLLTLATRRTPPLAEGEDSAQATDLAFMMVILAGAGLGAAWLQEPAGFASAWPAPVAISLGLLLFRFPPAGRHLEPGDLLLPAERGVNLALRHCRVFCRRNLSRARNQVERRMLALWDGEAWSGRMQWLDLRLRAWPVTSVLMLLVAIAMAFLMAR